MDEQIFDLNHSPIGLGLAALGRPGYINLGHGKDLGADYEIEAMEERAHRVLDAAWDAGVRYVDAARSYGRAEAFLASWLKTRGRQASELTIGSKWGYTYTADWQVQADAHEVKQHTIEVLNQQIEESRELLGLHLDLYQVHSATLESGILDNRQVLDRLAELKQSGLAIGLSVSGPSQAEVVRKAIGIEYDGLPLFDSCQATWNLLETSAGEALAEAHDRGLAIIIKEGVANGRLTTRNETTHFAEQRSILEGMATRRGVTIDAIALAYVLAQPWVATVLSGAATEPQLLSNYVAGEIEFTPSERVQLSGLNEISESYWQTRSNLAWN